MSNAAFQIVRQDPAHDRVAFPCNLEPLNRSLREHVTQDVRPPCDFCFVALVDGNRIAGYDTLASSNFLVSDLPASISKKLPCDPTVPAVRMGRLAIDNAFKGQGPGGALLADALILASHSDIASYAMIVEARDDAAAAFSRHHGFIAFPDRNLSLFLPLATAQSLQRSNDSRISRSSSIETDCPGRFVYARGKSNSTLS